MEKLRRTDVLEALEAVDCCLRELEDKMQPLKRQVTEAEGGLDWLREKRELASTWYAQMHLIPDDSDVYQAVENFADGLDTCIQRRAAALRPTKLELDQMVEKQQIFHGKRTKLMPLVSPVEVLPEELLVEIWKWARSDQLYLLYEGVPFPYVASWVTPRWRKIALGNPSLWSQVHVSSSRSIEQVKTQVARSKDCSLEVMVSFKPKSDVETSLNQEKLQDLIDVISACSYRWYSLELGQSMRYSDPPSEMVDMYTETIMGSLATLSAPRLKHLCMRWLGHSYTLPLFVEGAPALSHVKLRNMDIRSNLSLLQGLTHLHLADVLLPSGCLTQSEMRGLFEACPLLSNLALEDKCFALDSPIASRSVIIAPTLRSLSLRLYNIYDDFDDFDAEKGWTSNFFSIMSMPALQSLQLAFPFEFYKSFITAMELIPPSSRFPLLSKLSLYTDDARNPYPFDVSLARQLLVLFPHIDHLDLGCADEDIRCLLDALGYAEASGGSLCPCLRTLSIYTLPYEPFIQPFLARRASIGFPLVTYRMDFRCLQDDYFFDTIQEHVTVEPYDSRAEQRINFTL